MPKKSNMKSGIIQSETKYKVYNKLTNYTDFVDYCLRGLGSPIIDINISGDQILDRITDALQYFLEYDLESVSECYFLYRVTDDDVSNGYLSIPPDVLDVMEILTSSAGYSSVNTEPDENSKLLSIIKNPIYGNRYVYSDGTISENLATGQSVNGIHTTDSVHGFLTDLQLGRVSFGEDSFMTSFSYNWWNNYWNYGFSFYSGNQSLFYYEITAQYMNLLEQTFTARTEFFYRRRQHKLWMYSKPLYSGQLLCLYGTKILDPETDECIWESDWLKQYATCLLGMQWGTNLSKFKGVQGPGGVEISGDEIYSKYKEEKERLLEEHRKKFQEPPLPFRG